MGCIRELASKKSPQKDKTYSHDAENTIGSRSECIPRSSVLRWEDLRGVTIQHSIHDVAEEVVTALPTKQCIGSLRGRGGVEEHASQDGGNSQCSFSSELWDLDKYTSSDCARNPKCGDDQRVTISQIC